MANWILFAAVQWEALFDAFLVEAKWISSGYLPSFNKYLENDKVSFGYRAATLQPILTLDIPFPPQILQEIDFPSKFNDLASSILRLRGDVCGYQVINCHEIKSELHIVRFAIVDEHLKLSKQALSPVI